MKRIEKEFNIQTGEETITEREETQSETKLRLKFEADFAIYQAEAQAKEIARAAILKRMGLTADEAALLLA
jgi:hypothetical protein